MPQLRSSRCIQRLSAAAMVLILACISTPSGSQSISTAALLTRLQKGGQVIVMRHASSPRAEPDKTTANPDNMAMERQLDETGRTTAAAMGEALRQLHIPVGKIFSSPTYRALETVELARLPTPRTYSELGDGGASMQSVSTAQTEWLQKQAALFPKRSNTLIVTHMPNISAAFPQQATKLADGEALIFGSDGKGGVTLLARIRIEEWPRLGK